MPHFSDRQLLVVYWFTFSVCLPSTFSLSQLAEVTCLSFNSQCVCQWGQVSVLLHYKRYIYNSATWQLLNISLKRAITSDPRLVQNSLVLQTHKSTCMSNKWVNVRSLTTSCGWLQSLFRGSQHAAPKALIRLFFKHNLCHNNIQRINSAVSDVCRWKEEINCRLQRQLFHPNQGETVCLGQSHVCSLSLKGGNAGFKTGKHSLSFKCFFTSKYS